MILVRKKLSDIKVYSGNPRAISEEAVQKVRKSIEAYGYRQPIVLDEDDVIIAGHTRFAALLGIHRDTGQYEEIECHVAVDLTPDQVRQYRIVDNQVANLTEWDFTKLRIELGGLDSFDYLDFGIIPDFTQEESGLDDLEPLTLEEDLPESDKIKLSFGSIKMEITEAQYADWSNYALSKEASLELFIRKKLGLDPQYREYTEIDL